MPSRCLTAFGVAFALAFLISPADHRSPVPALVQTLSAQADRCADLRQTRLPGVTITASDRVAAGAFTPPTPAPAAAAARYAALPEFCRVQATLAPSSDSEIRIEVWLPASNWNGRFEAVGGRALGGIIVYPAMAEAVAAGYVSASTDTGHVGAGGAFGLGHPEKVVDHGHRAIHEMTVTAKQLVSAFYARPADRAYFNGCSLGGRQGLAEAAGLKPLVLAMNAAPVTPIGTLRTIANHNDGATATAPIVTASPRMFSTM